MDRCWCGLTPTAPCSKERLPLAPLRWEELVVDASRDRPADNLADS